MTTDTQKQYTTWEVELHEASNDAVYMLCIYWLAVNHSGSICTQQDNAAIHHSVQVNSDGRLHIKSTPQSAGSFVRSSLPHDLP